MCLHLQTLFTMIPKGTLGAPCTKEQIRQQRSHTPYFYSKKIPRHMMLWQRNERMTTNMELPQGTPIILKKTWLFPFGRTFFTTDDSNDYITWGTGSSDLRRLEASQLSTLLISEHCCSPCLHRYIFQKSCQYKQCNCIMTSLVHVT